MTRIGYPAEWLRPDEVIGRTPGVASSAIADEGAIFNPSEGWVELPPLIDRLVQQIIDRGGAVLPGVGRSQVVVENDRVTGVRTGTGETVDVDAAVLATGPGVPPTVAELGLTIPDATSVALLIRTSPVGTSLRAVLNTPRVSLRPTPSGSLVMDSEWSVEEVVTRDDGTYQVDDSTAQRLLQEASAVLEGNPTLTVESYGVGPKPVPGDGHPSSGSFSGSPGTTSPSVTAERRWASSSASCSPRRSCRANAAPCWNRFAPNASGRIGCEERRACRGCSESARLRCVALGYTPSL